MNNILVSAIRPAKVMTRRGLDILQLMPLSCSICVLRSTLPLLDSVVLVVNWD